MSAPLIYIVCWALCAPILVTSFASRARVPVSEPLCGPQNWTNAQYYKNAVILHALSGEGQILQRRAMSQQTACKLF